MTENRKRNQTLTIRLTAAEKDAIIHLHYFYQYRKGMGSFPFDIGEFRKTKL